MLNLGYLEAACINGDTWVRIYYQPQYTLGLTQALMDGPRGYCLDVTNRSGAYCRAVIGAGTLAPMTLDLAAGDPVVSQSRTAAQLLLLGFASRQALGDVQILS